MSMRIGSVLLIIILKLLAEASVQAQSDTAKNHVFIDADVPVQQIYSGHLKLGGTDPAGKPIEVNNYYISMNRKPVIPVAGEFHFSRYPKAYWDESIKKMKAGGITVISTYVFWNLHEEEEGRFAWSGDKDLRSFIALCKQNSILAIVRIGPFCHGEIRNGGLPDWLLGRPLNIRMNDPLYLHYVERLYKEIAKQLKGLYYKDGGPVIGLQLENEYQHSAAPWGLTYPGQPNDMTAAERDRDITKAGVSVSGEVNPYADLGNDHMKALKTLAEKAGLITPLYTATGWGNAAIVANESIPVTAAYAYPFWTPKRDLSPFFLYKNLHVQPDYSPVRYNPVDYPAFSAELGSGISLTYQRRPVVVHQSFDAMINRCLGSGANGVGYYMYHGGSTPKGKAGFMNDEAFGLNKISYEYQGPIGEYGQIREGYNRLKLLHFFLQDFGDQLAPMGVVLPESASRLKPDNIHDLRFALRSDGKRGFIFLNNFQDDTTLTDKKDIRVTIKTADGTVNIPETGGFDLVNGENVMLPFNFNLNGAQLHYATAQLLMKEDGDQPYFVFFTPEGIQGQFFFKPGCQVENRTGTTVEQQSSAILVKCRDEVCEFAVTANRRTTTILVIKKELALKSYRVSIRGKKYMLFTDALVLEKPSGVDLLSEGMNRMKVTVYPRTLMVPKLDHGVITSAANAVFTEWKITLPAVEFKMETKEVSSRKIAVSLPASLPRGVNDIYLTVNYTGDTGMGFINGELVADNFYNGIPWQIGLRKFITAPVRAGQLVLYFRPMRKNASYLLDLQPYPQYIPDFGSSNSYLSISGLSFTPQYKNSLQF